jgi:superfamily I DNA/RNA helicase
MTPFFEIHCNQLTLDPVDLPVVALPGVGQMPAKDEDEQEAARVFYVAATRVTQRLVMGIQMRWKTLQSVKSYCLI